MDIAAQMKDVFTPLQTACLATTCFCSLVAFSAMADAPYYDKISAFQFTVAAGVLTWIYALGVLIIPWVARSLPPGMDLENFVKRGNQAAFIFCYTAAISCSSVSSSLSNVDCHSSFCSKVYASCTFTWFSTIALLVAVLDKEGVLEKGVSNDPGPYAAHHEEQAPPSSEAAYAPPPSADL
mmetsp:Transcript_59278/g.111882  ORF Transcript_59278/g.111882 Transcript_59278/m.111882 type:complete len:181 (-) Transcript_59278:305-847(-)